VLDVVAVSDEPGGEVAEAQEYLRLVPGTEQRRVLLEGVVRRGRGAVEALDVVAFQVDVDGMPPAAAPILQDPSFRCSLPDPRIDTILVVESSVHLPRALAADELELA